MLGNVNDANDYTVQTVTRSTRSQAVGRIADRTVSQQTIVISDCY